MNVLSWSGPVPSSDVLRDAQVVVGGDLLQRGLPVEAGAELGGLGDHRVEDAVDDLGGAFDAELYVDRTEQRLDGVGQDRCLVATAGGFFAATEAYVVADAERTGDDSQGLGADDGSAQLGQLAFGQIGVLGEKGVGDDEPEHRVAEELEALVVGDATVLVRERTVRQGMLKKPGIKILDTQDLPERVSVD